MSLPNRAWIELNLDHLIHNLHWLQKLTAPGCALMPAVKANAYGHGSVPVARTLQAQGIRHFCVASVEEGVQLRKAGITGEILILGYTAPDVLEEVERYQLTQTVVDISYGRLLQHWWEQRHGLCASPAPLPVHVAVDTGMHRLGESWEQEDALASLWRLPGLRVTGLFSHLCVSDSLAPEDRAYTRLQIQRFQKVTESLRRRGCSGFSRHLLASYGLLNNPECSLDLARPGIALYGCLSSPGDQTLYPLSLRPVLTLKTRVASLKALAPGEAAGYGLAFRAEESRTLAILSIGYGDGIPRSFSGRGTVLIQGQEAPVVGRICMDQMLVDATHIPGLVPGMEAVLIGASGGRTLTAELQAERAGTIANELLSRLGNRLPRFSLGNPALS